MKLVEKREAKKRVVINEVGLLIQAVLLFFAIAIGIITFFEPAFSVELEFVLALMLFVMAYNNVKVYKRSLFTIPYIIGAIICLVTFFSQILTVF